MKRDLLLLIDCLILNLSIHYNQNAMDEILEQHYGGLALDDQEMKDCFEEVAKLQGMLERVSFHNYKKK